MDTGSTHTRDEAAMHITTKGQVTIPQDIRERFGMLPHTEVQFRVDGDRVYLEKETGQSTRGVGLVRHMTGRATVNLTTDQILALTRGEE
jgi:AbrB family looped-hinge helix DNA binding protein